MTGTDLKNVGGNAGMTKGRVFATNMPGREVFLRSALAMKDF